MATRRIEIPEAFAFLLTKKARYKGLYGGRGSAKSHSIARALLVKGAQQRLRIVCCREIQKSIKDSVHKLLEDLIKEYKLEEFYTVKEREITGKNGTEFLFIGLKYNTRDIKSLEGADIAWIEEAEIVSDNSYEILIPTIRKPDSEIWTSFNVKNVSDPTYRRMITEADANTISKKVSWRDNPYFPEVLRVEMEKLKKSDHDAYLHVWEGEPDTRKSGAVYAKQIARMRQEGRITKVPYDPASEVFTAWDLGFGDSTAIWWLQFIGRELRWIDYYENYGELTSHYIETVKRKKYRYGTMYLPHDGAHQNIRGPSVENQLQDAGFKVRVLERETILAPGIDLARQTFEYSVMDADKCKDGIRCLENNAYMWDEDRACFSKNPYHDWTEHGASAARYAAIAASLEKVGLGKRKPQSFAMPAGRAPI